MAQLLGPDTFGQAALVLAYVALIDLLFNFQSARLVIRYGAQAVIADDLLQLGRLLKLSFLLDLGSAVLATAIAVSLARAISGMIDGADVGIYYLYSLTILGNIVGHATGLLRLFDRFSFLSFHAFISPALRLGAVAAVSIAPPVTLRTVIVALVVAEIAAKSVLLVRGLIEIRRKALVGFMSLPLKGITVAHRDIVNFAIFSNVNDSVLKVVQQLDLFIVAYLLAPTDAGLFRVIKSLGSIPALISGAISRVVYPEMAKLHAESSGHLRVFIGKLRITLGILAVIGMGVYVLVGDPLISLTFGADYRQAFPASVVYMAGTALGLVALPLTPLFLVTGRQRQLFVAYLVSSGAYLLAISFGASFAGLLGAAFALPVLYVFYLLVIGLLNTDRGS
jgi:O-antigen/teichoic acid export membrane protein